MAHELEIRKDGTASMFYVGEKCWHGLGKKLDNPPTSAEGIKAAGLDWTVSCHQMEAWLDIDGKEVCMPAQSRMVVRDSDHHRLSEVGNKWAPLQNIDAFKWFDPFLASGECSLETAGSLFEGKRIWVLAKLNRDPIRIVGDDTIDKYLLLSNSHSDERSARVGYTPIRVCCNNTLCAAMRNKRTSMLGVKHTANIVANMEAVRATINNANEQFEATAEQYRSLTKIQVDQNLLKKYIKIVFKADDDDEDKVITRQVKEDDSRLIENKITPLFEGGLGANLPGAAGTLWGAYNAITEYLTWHAGRTVDNRLDSLWFGQNANVNKRALDIALELAKKAA